MAGRCHPNEVELQRTLARLLKSARFTRVVGPWAALAACASGCASIGRDSAPSRPGFEAPPIDPLPAADLSPLSPSVAPAVDPPRAEVLSSPGSADLDPTNDELVGPPNPVPDCDERLRAAGIAFR